MHVSVRLDGHVAAFPRDSLNNLSTPRALATQLAFILSAPDIRLTLDRTLFDVIRNILRTSSIDLAAHTEGSSQDLQHGAFQLTREGLVGTTHGLCYVDDLIERDGLRMFDVLLLFAVARRLFQSADDKG